MSRGERLTSREAALLLGVSAASVKRWADSGLLPMERTAGGHRRFRPEDVVVIRRAGPGAGESGRPEGRPAARLPARSAQRPALSADGEAGLVHEAFRTLVGGRDEALSALLLNLHLGGQSVGTIADTILCAAMRRVGELWHAGELSVAQEHVATSTATSALQSLQAVLVTPGEGRMRALCCSVESDFHELPLRLAALTLEACGLAVFNFGTNAPFSALAEAVGRFRPDLVCVSSTLLAGRDRAAREYAEFYKAARRVRARVVLGGAGFADAAVRKRLPADLHAEGFRQMEGFVAALASGES